MAKKTKRHDDRLDLLSFADYTGGISDRFRYHAFGEVEYNESGQPIVAPMFGGMRWMEEFGLYLSENRLYDPKTGSWLSHDALGYIDSPNLYSYCSHNPIDFVDPLGLSSKPATKSGQKKVVWNPSTNPYNFFRNDKPMERDKTTTPIKTIPPRNSTGGSGELSFPIKLPDISGLDKVLSRRNINDRRSNRIPSSQPQPSLPVKKDNKNDDDNIMDNIALPLNVWGFSAGVKEYLLDGGASLNRNIPVSKVNDFSLIRTYGIGVTKYIKYSKGFGALGSGITTVSAGFKVYDQLTDDNGRGIENVIEHRDILDVVVGGVGIYGFFFLTGPIGLAVGAVVLLYGAGTMIYDEIEKADKDKKGE